jgi:hypothetical protein
MLSLQLVLLLLLSQADVCRPAMLLYHCISYNHSPHTLTLYCLHTLCARARPQVWEQLYRTVAAAVTVEFKELK